MDHSWTRIFSFPNSLYSISQSIIILELAESEQSVYNESIVLLSASRSEGSFNGKNETHNSHVNSDQSSLLNVLCNPNQTSCTHIQKGCMILSRRHGEWFQTKKLRREGLDLHRLLARVQQLLLCNNATFDDIILQHLMTSFWIDLNDLHILLWILKSWKDK